MFIIPGIIVGLIAGYAASWLQKGHGNGCIINTLLGIAGGILGSWLSGLFGLSVNSWVGETIVAIVGAIILIWIVDKIRR